MPAQCLFYIILIKNIMTGIATIAKPLKLQFLKTFLMYFLEKPSLPPLANVLQEVLRQTSKTRLYLVQ